MSIKECAMKLFGCSSPLSPARISRAKALRSLAVDAGYKTNIVYLNDVPPDRQEIANKLLRGIAKKDRRDRREFIERISHHVPVKKVQIQ